MLYHPESLCCFHALSVSDNSRVEIGLIGPNRRLGEIEEPEGGFPGVGKSTGSSSANLPASTAVAGFFF